MRSIGYVLHCEPIEASSGARGFTKDWALIELNKTMIDWDSFKGNMVYVGAPHLRFYVRSVFDHAIL